MVASRDVYWVHTWGYPYFSVNKKGHVVVQPNHATPKSDLYELVQALIKRGIEAPILIRFEDIVRDRISHLHAAFDQAIEEFHYKNSYQVAYPVKVNPQYHVVDFIEEAGSKHLIGLEVGSKPELIAVLTISQHIDSLLLCNGYKDADYIELALLARKLGRRSILIIEQLYELPLVLEIAQKLKIDAEMGFRLKLSQLGSGRWKTSGGDLAKFGLSTHEIVHCFDVLRKAGKQHWLTLLHFHIGSQITSIDSIKRALNEASRMYTELAADCPSLCFFDAGGGLGVDYDGSKTTSDSSMNYTLEEYARDVVSAIGDACDKAEIPHPIILTESGRALVAHHSVLITEVIDVTPTVDPHAEIEPPDQDKEIPLQLYQLYQKLKLDNCLEALHDANELKGAMLETFIHGDLTIYDRAYCEKIYWHLIARIYELSKGLPYIPEDIENLSKILFDTYFCNFSVFQSLPDSWAIEHLFPIMPIHRLNETPSRPAILADLSCDSDGKIDRFVGRKGYKSHIPLHEWDGSPYFLGIFLTGAYQEILGGLHNLFGDTNAVHVELDEEGEWQIKHVVEGNTIEEVLQYTQYNPQFLLKQLRGLIEKALKAGRLTAEESAKLQKRFKEALESYTYLIV